MATKPQSLLGAIGVAVSGTLLLVLIGLFVWLATLSTRVTVLEETRVSDKEARTSIERANQDAVNRIEHEREANDARVATDLRELRAKVFK